jgi:hypothetical protein
MALGCSGLSCYQVVKKIQYFEIMLLVLCLQDTNDAGTALVFVMHTQLNLHFQNHIPWLLQSVQKDIS